MSNPVDDNPKADLGKYRFFSQEYWVDFLGGLLPGTLFLIAVLFALAPPYFLLLSTITSDPTRSFSSIVAQGLRTTTDTPGMVWFVVASVLTAMAYTIGHIFYRRDPNTPNKRSFQLLAARWAEDHKDRDRTPEQVESDLRKEYGCGLKDECDFPFPYFYDYLKHRGLDHLCPFVVWRNNLDHRTKNIINILKIRMQFYYPEKCRTIIRNEAHVRLASSVWYVAGAVRWCSILGMAVIGASLFLYFSAPAFLQAGLAVPEYLYGTNDYNARCVSATASVLLVLFGSLYARRRVESFLHYQRQREVVHVLETAWTAFRRNPEELTPPFNIGADYALRTDRAARKPTVARRGKRKNARP